MEYENHFEDHGLSFGSALQAAVDNLFQPPKYALEELLLWSSEKPIWGFRGAFL